MKNRAIPDQPDILTDDIRIKPTIREVVLIQEEIPVIESYDPDVLSGMRDRVYDDPPYDDQE